MRPGDRAHYFGPYHSALGARKTLRVVNRHFQLRTCSDFTLDHRTRACLQYQIDRCPAPCVLDVDEERYGQQVRGVALFLAGRHRELIDQLQARMKRAAVALEFELAARVRDQLRAIEMSLERQHVVSSEDKNQDAIGMYREGGQVEFVVMHVRGGKLLGTRSHSARGMELPDHDVLHSFLTALYESAPTLPEEVLLPVALLEDDAGPLAALLSERAGAKVSLKVPARGPRRTLVRLATRNAGSNFVTRRDRSQDMFAALEGLRDRLKLSRLPRVIECFDISHIQGSDAVASMVVFVDGVPARRRYRSFRIKGGVDGLAQGAFQNEDFASMYEVLGRRLRRGLALASDDGERGDERERVDAASSTEDGVAEDPWALPDLLVIDGGKGQLGRVIAAMQDLGVSIGAEGVDIVSLAKERRAVGSRGVAHQERSTREEAAPGKRRGSAGADKPERVFLPGVKEALRLRPGSSEFFLMTQVRDEAHRFAITHHRKRRGKRALRSSLDAIKGVGPTTKRALLKHFGSVAAVRAADQVALVAVTGVGPALAATIERSLADAATESTRK
jgi:excinuclease ABC subunit C